MLQMQCCQQGGSAQMCVFKKIWNCPKQFLMQTMKQSKTKKNPNENKKKPCVWTWGYIFPVVFCLFLVFLLWGVFRRLSTIKSIICFSRDDTEYTPNCGWTVSKPIGIVLFQIIIPCWESSQGDVVLRSCGSQEKVLSQYRFSKSGKGDVEEGVCTRVRERYGGLAKGNVIRATQITGEEKYRHGIRYHLTDSFPYSKAHCTGKFELMLP